MILCIDPGTKCGWATYDVDTKKFQSGVFDLSVNRFMGGGMRYLNFKRELEKMVPLAGQHEVYFEEVKRHRGTDAAHVYGGLIAVLTSFCEEREIPYQGVPVGTIKKSFTGKGNAKKPAMIAEAVKRGHHPKDDNEADALAIAHWYIEEKLVNIDASDLY